MGTMESIYHGVPMVGVPLFGDQHANIQMYVKKNMAVKLELGQITTEKLKNSIKEILDQPQYRCVHIFFLIRLMMKFATQRFYC